MLVAFQVVPRTVLLDAYQHQLLAIAAALLICLTPVPAAGALLVVLTQLWRTTVVRRSARPTEVFDEQAERQRRLYFKVSIDALRFVGAALFVGFVAPYLLEPPFGLWLAKLLLAGALIHGGGRLLLAYGQLQRLS